MSNTGGGVDGGQERAGRRDRRRERQQQRHRSGGGSGRIALILAVVGLVLVVVFIIPRGRGKSAEPLPRVTLATSTPINSTDPTSGKPVVPGVTSVYKGYTIGHCCDVSGKDWEALSAEQKDTFVRGFLR